MGNEIKATEPENQIINERNEITDVYIGVFFDGTSNNMVQKSAYERQKNKKKDWGIWGNWVKDDLVGSKWNRFLCKKTLSNILKDDHKYKKEMDSQYDTLKKILNCNDDVISNLKKINNSTKKKELILKHLGIYDIYKNDIDKLTTDEILSLINAHNRAVPQHTNGYSNIGILYYMLNIQPHHKNSAIYTFYIEGSGATDISKLSHNNTNGLGFGLGETGVVALVGKAVKLITNYINSIKSKFNSGTVNIHFLIFGFSRGSTCARLLSYIIAKDNKEELGKREQEFSISFENDNQLFKDNKLSFLKEGTYNKSVDFLGIYDTVASIGFLKQKDGWINPLRFAYSWAPNYKDNWHYKNVTEYGLYSPIKKVKRTCHICAIDEFRENFALTDIGKIVPDNGVEIFIPGCHSDIGGGYYDGDEEQEISLKKYIEKGIEKELEDQSKRTNVEKKPVFFSNSFLFEDYNDKALALDWEKVLKNTFSIEAFRKFWSEHLLGLKSLSRLGWLDENWDDAEKGPMMIEKNGKWVPCTIRVIDENRLLFKRDRILFKRNITAGYSNIPLRMMKQYAEIFLISPPLPNGTSLSALFSDKQTILDTEYPVPVDLKDMEEKIKNLIAERNKNLAGIRLWLYPKNEEYKKLRMKYLHFTSTSDFGHCNGFWAKDTDDVRLYEGNMGNLGNTPNHDLNGRICRIIYHGDKKEENGKYSLNYMHEYDEEQKKEGIVIIPCSKIKIRSKKGSGLSINGQGYTKESC